MAGTGTRKTTGKGTSTARKKTSGSTSSYARGSGSSSRSASARTRSTKGRTSSADRGYRSKKKAAEDEVMRQDLLVIGSFALSIFLFLSCFGILGPVGNFFAGMMFGLCGVTAYVLPFFVFGAVLYYEIRKDAHETPALLGAACALFVTIGTIAEMASGDLAAMPSYDLADLYNLCATYKRGGGILAGSIAYLFYHFLGVPGTVLIILLVLALCTVILSQKPLVRMVGERARRAQAERVRLRQEEEEYRAAHPEEFADDEEDGDFPPYDEAEEGDEEPPWRGETAARGRSPRQKAAPESGRGVRFFRGTPDNTLLNPDTYKKPEEGLTGLDMPGYRGGMPVPKQEEEEEKAPQPAPKKEEKAPQPARTAPAAETYQERAPQHNKPKEEAPAPEKAPEPAPAKEETAPAPAPEATSPLAPDLFAEEEEDASEEPEDLSVPGDADDFEDAPKEPPIDFFPGVAPVRVDQDPIHLEAQYDAQQEAARKKSERAPLFASEDLHEILPEDYGNPEEEPEDAEHLILPGPDESREALPAGEVPPLPRTEEFLRSFVPQDVGQESASVKNTDTQAQRPHRASSSAAPSPALSRLGVLTFEDDEWVPEEDEDTPAPAQVRSDAPQPSPAPVQASPAPKVNTARENPVPAAHTNTVPPLADIPIHREAAEPQNAALLEAPPLQQAASEPQDAAQQEENFAEEAVPEAEAVETVPASQEVPEPVPQQVSSEKTSAEAEKAPAEAEEAAPVSPAMEQEEKEQPSAPTEIYHVDDLPVRKPAPESAPQQASPAGRPAFRSRAVRDFVTSEAASDASDILVRKEGTLSGKTEIVEEAKAEEEKERQVRQIQETQEQQAQERKVAPIPQEEAAPAPAAAPRPYVTPPIDLLRPGTKIDAAASEQELRETAAKLQSTLETFGVRVHITEISQGPAVTRYEMQPEMGVKVSKILALQDDIKLALAATDIRIEAPIPGKSAVGVEVPNVIRETVSLRDVLDSKEFRSAKSKTSFGVGKDLSGKIVVTDIAKMPHVLIAGATGSGKSVCINTMIMSILYHASPSEVKLIMIDPKVVELSVYNGIPHLMLPVVTDSQKAAATLNWCVAEMESRFKRFAENQVRDIKGYNALVKSRELEGDTSLAFMPSIVIIVDELADLMMVAKSEVETAICRLAQLARAAGMHLVIATQRPSVDVITGLIKANMPSRIAFAVTSGVDSRTILDMNGAEKLLGKGDMLFFPYGLSKPVRIQGAFVTDDEVNSVVNFLKMHDPAQESTEELEKKIESLANSGSSSGNDSGASQGKESDSGVEDLFVDAGFFIIEKNNASIGLLQRRFRIGFNKAARIMDQLCDAGVVSDSESTKSRKILMTKAEFQDYVDNYL